MNESIFIDLKKELIKNKQDFLYKEEKTIDGNDGYAKVEGMIPYIKSCKIIEKHLKDKEIQKYTDSLCKLVINKIIEDVFNTYWTGESTLSSIENMKKQLHKNLRDQINGYWSGHSAYAIMTRGGFLIDGKRSTRKELTALGKIFIEQMNEELKCKN